MKTCLVVEDSAIIQKVTMRILEEFDFKPLCAADAVEGVESCRQLKPDAVLLDWDLPNFGALDFLRDFVSIPQEDRPIVVLCATENDSEQFKLAKSAGAKYHVLKPYNKDALREVFAEIGWMDPLPSSTVDKLVPSAG